MVMRVRQVAAVLAAVIGFAGVARLVFGWLLGLEGWALALSEGALALLGLAAGIDAARNLEPWSEYAQRDAILGWGAILTFVAALVCLGFVPMPWAWAVAGLVVIASIVAMRTATRSLPRRPM